MAFDLTPKTAALSVGPAGRPGVRPCDLSCLFFLFFDCSSRNTCGLSSGLVKAGISERGRVTPPVGTFTVRKRLNVLKLHVKCNAFQVLLVFYVFHFYLDLWTLSSFSIPLETWFRWINVKSKCVCDVTWVISEERTKAWQKGAGRRFPVETDSLLSKGLTFPSCWSASKACVLQWKSECVHASLIPRYIRVSSFWGLTRRPNKVRLSSFMGFD